MFMKYHGIVTERLYCQDMCSRLDPTMFSETYRDHKMAAAMKFLDQYCPEEANTSHVSSLEMRIAQTIA